MNLLIMVNKNASISIDVVFNINLFSAHSLMKHTNLTKYRTGTTKWMTGQKLCINVATQFGVQPITVL